MSDAMEQVTNQVFDDVGKFGASEDRSIADIASNTLLDTISLGSRKLFLGLFLIWVEFFTFYLNIPLRFDFGERKFNLVFLMIGMIGIQLIGVFVETYNSIGFVTGNHVDYSVFLFFSKCWFINGLIHYGWLIYRRYFQPTKKVYSLSAGRSWLYFPYQRLCRRFNFSYLNSEADFQKWIEPLLVIIFALILRSLGVGGFSSFLILCAICSHIQAQLVENNLRDLILDAMDGQIINEALAKVHSDQQSHHMQHGFGMSQAMINDARKVTMNEVKQTREDISDSINRQNSDDQDSISEMKQNQNLS